MASTWYEFFCLHRKYLIYTLVLRNLKVKYRGSFFGFFWTLLIPFSQVAVFYFVYNVVLKVEIPNYLAFIVSGILPWVFFSSTINESFDTLTSGQNLLSQVPIPLQAFPAAAVITHFSNFVFSIPILVIVILASGISISWPAALFMPLSIFLLLFAYSLAFTMACLFVLFRDLKHLFSIAVQLWLYVTPILYSVEVLPEKYHWLLYANPLSGYFVGLRDILIYNRWPDPVLLSTFFGWSILSVLVANGIRTSIGGRLVEKL